MVLSPWKFSPQAIFSRRKKPLQQKHEPQQPQQVKLAKSALIEPDDVVSTRTLKLSDKHHKDKFSFRRWHPRKRKRTSLIQQECRGAALRLSRGTDSSSALNGCSSSFECENSTASNEFDDNHGISCFTDLANSLSPVDFDHSVCPANGAEFLLDSSTLGLCNHLEVNPLEMYFQSRHERAMVRLCALLWILKLEEDRSRRPSETDSSWDEEEEEEEEENQSLHHEYRIHLSERTDKVFEMDTNSALTSPRQARNRCLQVTSVGCVTMSG